MNTATFVIDKILGKRKTQKDSDNDGVSDKEDCQPFNTMRQDNIGVMGLAKMQQQLNSSPQQVQMQKMQKQQNKILEQQAKTKIRSKIY